MENSGFVFRNIRIGKGYSLKEISEGILSLSLLSKFERGESEITISKFYSLLERLNLTLDEYSLISNDYQPLGIEKLLQTIRKAYENNNVNFLLKLQEEQLNKWEKYQLNTYKYNAIMIHALANNLDESLVVDDDDIHLLIDYLFKIENWGLYEIILFGNSMNILPTETIVTLSKEILSKTELYNSIKKNKEELIRVILNAIIICIQDDRISIAHYFIIATEKLIGESVYYFEKVKLLFLKGIYKVRTKDIEMGIYMAKKAIAIMVELGDENIAYNHEEYLNDIILQSSLKN